MLAVAAAGDRIVVGPGVYPGFLLDKPVSLESTYGAAATIIDGGGAASTVVVDPGAEGATIGRASKGFTIRGGATGILVTTTDITIADNVIAGGDYGVLATGFTARLKVTADALAPNCGIVNNALFQGLVFATGNFWGSESGAGPLPANDVCNHRATTTPFLRAPAAISNTAGR